MEIAAVLVIGTRCVLARSSLTLGNWERAEELEALISDVAAAAGSANLGNSISTIVQCIQRDPYNFSSENQDPHCSRVRREVRREVSFRV